MAEQLAVGTTSMPEVEAGRNVTRKAVVALVAVLVVQAFFALCLVSALQLLVPRNMPFGVVGSPQVVAQAQSTAGLDIVGYTRASRRRWTQSTRASCTAPTSLPVPATR